LNGKIKGKDLTAVFLYDYKGDRVKKTENNISTYYYGGIFEVENTTQIKYYGANGQRVCENRDGTKLWYHGDYLNSTSRITNSQGKEAKKLGYKPFGEDAYNIDSGTNPTFNPKLCYTGKEKDISGLYFYGARYYDPVLGRFMQPDNFHDSGTQGLNRYAYCSNNPLKYNDPSGHSRRVSIVAYWDESSGNWFDGKGKKISIENMKPYQYKKYCEYQNEQFILQARIHNLAGELEAKLFREKGLTEEEIRILVAFVAMESNSGNSPLDECYMKAWTFLNKLEYDAMYGLAHPSDESLNNLVYISWKNQERDMMTAQNIGVTDPSIAGQMKDLLDYYSKYKSGAYSVNGCGGYTFKELDNAVRVAVKLWREYGRFSEKDPVCGAISFIAVEGMYDKEYGQFSNRPDYNQIRSDYNKLKDEWGREQRPNYIVTLPFENGTLFVKQDNGITLGVTVYTSTMFRMGKNETYEMNGIPNKPDYNQLRSAIPYKSFAISDQYPVGKYISE
jgi:RHS repeat-associated protein